MIEIDHAELIKSPVGDVWSCMLQITQGSITWMLPATASATLDEGDLQAYFDASEDELWVLAQIKQYPVDIFERIPHKRVLKAFALVVLDEINILRVEAGLPERTAQQLMSAIKAKLKE